MDNSKNLEEYKRYLREKKALLNKVVTQLKTEFVGLDTVIDQITSALSGWFYFPEMQERPVIINLWGLTGIGKTSLVKRLAQLLEMEELYYRFDLGESSSSEYSIQDTFKEIYENANQQPFILGLDEFQLARTINEEGEEIDKASSRAIWDLLDSGKFDLIDFNSYQMGVISRLIKKLDKALMLEVEVENGVVTNNLDEFKKIFPDNQNDDIDDEDDDEENKSSKSNKIKTTYFVSSDYLYNIFNIDTNAFLSTYEIRDELNKLNGEQTIEFLIDIYKKAMKPVTIDCTKALIFVMGNLDEVYSMTQNFNPDISADEFHKESLEISITQVKNSLLNRFRSEQIARLGNNHIIYPSFNANSFKKIIDLELEKLNKKLLNLYAISLEFDESLKELIYQEGVYPTQGTRPLFTTIQQIVNSKLGDLLSEIFIEDHFATRLVFKSDTSVNDNDTVNLYIDFYNNQEKVYTATIQQKLVLGKLRKEKHDDQQAITAVHESGHAVLSSILMRTIPISIFSVTADNNSLGFVLSRPEWNYVSKAEVINRLAVLLGGLEAERLIFGDDKITIGASQDLTNATRLAMHVIYSCGFGKNAVSYGSVYKDNIPSLIFDIDASPVNNTVKDLLFEAQQLAASTLTKQRVLLLHLADYLCDKRMLDQASIEEYVAKYAVDFSTNEIIKDADNLFYRSHLKKEVKNILK